MIVPALILICALEGVHFLGDRSGRVREVYGGAFQVAHPEYRVLVDSTVRTGPLSTSAQVGAFELHPRSEGRR
ncbi:hypothetical protein ACWEPC_23115, partial [Nonomuraea sp. NPDC004297]